MPEAIKHLLRLTGATDASHPSLSCKQAPNETLKTYSVLKLLNNSIEMKLPPAGFGNHYGSCSKGPKASIG
jgi:hypothetical protein